DRSLQAARMAEPEANWRDRFRDRTAWKKREQLSQLANVTFEKSTYPSEHQLALLGLLLRNVGATSDSSRLLGEACRRQPRNFWFNREMAFSLVLETRGPESAAHYRAALTLKPDNAGAHWGLARVRLRGFLIDKAL